jgi:hypothetical protein
LLTLLAAGDWGSLHPGFLLALGLDPNLNPYHQTLTTYTALTAVSCQFSCFVWNVQLPLWQAVHIVWQVCVHCSTLAGRQVSSCELAQVPFSMLDHYSMRLVACVAGRRWVMRLFVCATLQEASAAVVNAGRAATPYEVGSPTPTAAATASITPAACSALFG